MKLAMLAALGAVGCVNRGDIASIDASTRADASDQHHADGGVTTSSNLTCKASMSTSVNADGTKTETTTRFAVAADVHLGDSFRLDMCDQKVTTLPTPQPGAMCPAGSTCTTSGDAYPTGTSCYVSRDGTFIGGVLVVSCGYTITNYKADGTVSYIYDLSYGSITVTK